MQAVTSIPGRIKTEIYQASAWHEVAPLWQELVKNSSTASFYLNPTWVECWLAVFGKSLGPLILVFEGDSAIVGACLLVMRKERSGPFSVKRIHLNAAGEEVADSTYIEFNDLLCRPGYERAVAEALRRHLDGLIWDEFMVSGCVQGTGLDALQNAFSDFEQKLSARSSSYVDLAWLRHTNSKYESTLSKNTRAQLARSFKLYGQRGPIVVQAASDVSSALDMLCELSDWHQRSWIRRGRRGAFASQRFLAFHRALVRRAFPDGGIQLIRVSAGSQPIGFLYNFVHRRKVYAYQSGFLYEDDNRLKPGLVTHTCAIGFCLEQDLNEYDFLAGEERYKGSLAKNSRALVWLAVRKDMIKLRIMDSARKLMVNWSRARMSNLNRCYSRRNFPVVCTSTASSAFEDGTVEERP